MKSIYQECVIIIAAHTLVFIISREYLIFSPGAGVADQRID
jgi:hypothetical protein